MSPFFIFIVQSFSFADLDKIKLPINAEAEFLNSQLNQLCFVLLVIPGDKHGQINLASAGQVQTFYWSEHLVAQIALILLGLMPYSACSVFVFAVRRQLSHAP